MKKFKIIISKANLYTGQVKKIKEESKLQTEVIYIEDLVEDDKNNLDFENSIIYFLCCNSPLISETIQKVEKYNCYIINKDYLVNKYLKLDVQMLLYSNNISVPMIYKTENIDNIKFPIFCKENRHQGIIMKVFNDITLTRFFDKFDRKDFYLEQDIQEDNIKINELKIYFVAGKIFTNDIKKCSNILSKICQNVSKVLNNLEVFSADIIQNTKGEYYIIDINPSAGFYMSDDGRRFFLDELTKK